jgi:hypothetical protein
VVVFRVVSSGVYGLCVPTQGLNKGQIVGAIVILNKNDGAFNNEDQDLLTEAAYHIALFIDNIYLHQHQRVAIPSGKQYQAEKRALNITLVAMAAAAGALILFLLALTFIPKLISSHRQEPGLTT